MNAAMKTKVWDGFVRGYHGLMILLLPALWWTAEEGMLERHQQLAMVLIALIIVRILWGFVGSESARFGYFLVAPWRAIRHFAELRKPQVYAPPATHNAAGGWFVLVLLGLLIVQMSTGLFATDDILFSGPLASWVSSDTQGWLTDIHKSNFDFLLLAIGLHIVAAVFYRVIGVRLIEAMWHGYQVTPAKAPVIVNGNWAWLVVVVIVALLWWLVI